MLGERVHAKTSIVDAGGAVGVALKDKGVGV